MPMRKYDPAKDAGATEVLLTFTHDPVFGWQASVDGELLSDGLDERVDDCLARLKSAGWLHLPVRALIRKMGGGGTTVQVHDPEVATGRYLFRDAAFSVCKMDNGQIRVSFLAEDPASEELVTGSKWYMDAAARQVEELMWKAASRPERLKVLERLTGMKNVMEYDQSGEVGMITVGDDDTFTRISIITWKDHTATPFFYEVESTDQYRRSAGPVPEPQGFGRLEEAMEFACQAAKQARLEMNASTASPGSP